MSVSKSDRKVARREAKTWTIREHEKGENGAKIGAAKKKLQEEENPSN